MTDSMTSEPAAKDVDVEKSANAPKNIIFEGPSVRPSPGSGTTQIAHLITRLERDSTVVDWAGPDDLQNPQNWPEKMKWLNIGAISMLSFVTYNWSTRSILDLLANIYRPIGSSMFAPGIPTIMAEFKETSPTAATFAVSIYVLGSAFGPLIVAPLSEVYGRRPLYIWGNILFTIFTVGTALSKNIPMLLAFRFLMGLAGSVPITIGSGSIADIMPIELRGRAMSAWALGPLLGPCIGPVVGGYLIQAAGWRWVFWLVAILGGIFIPLSFCLIKETYPPILLECKVANLRKETNNLELRSKLQTENYTADRFKFAIIRPLKLLLLIPIVTLMSLYTAITYGILFLLITTFAYVYKEKYTFDEGKIGLAFLPAGVGMMFGVIMFGTLTDLIVKRNQAKEIIHQPEFRLNPALTMSCGVLLPIGLFIYGWAAERGVHFIVPMIGVSIFAIGLMGVMICMQNYLLDSYPQYAASVTAALAVLRSLAGALLPLGGLEMYNTLGIGWGNSLLGFISLALIPIPLVFLLFGKRIRKKFELSV